MKSAASQLPPTFQPLLQVGDALSEYWLRQVTVRLRREIAWLWYQRTGERNAPDKLPPFTEPLPEALDQTRFAAQRARFFREDETAGYLTELLREAPPETRGQPARGSFTWVARELNLTPLDRFVLALAICPVIDSSAETVLAASLGNPAARAPTLALAQRLWDEPEAVLTIATTTHPFFRYGILSEPDPGHGIRHDSPLAIPPEIARALVTPKPTLPPYLVVLDPIEMDSNVTATICSGRLQAVSQDQAHVVPLIAEGRQSLGAMAAGVAAMAGRKVAAAHGFSQNRAGGDGDFRRLMTMAWLHGVDIYLRFDARHTHNGDGPATGGELPLPHVPIVLFVGIDGPREISLLPRHHRLPAVVVEPGTYAMRLEAWRQHLPSSDSPELAPAVRACARRFRVPPETIADICAGLARLDRAPEPDELIAACRSDLDLGELAQPVTPRFTRDELVLPQAQAVQFDEILRALEALGTVHYEWGTAGIWNESGLSALFAGPPGTGKTMAAEVIAAESRLPLFRVDLSQVVNKYIGETEKNLRRLFDSAEQSDIIIFFDEADSLFGKRTEVKDAHDRYANLEVSYLLERMERFKGLAILATNRKKDLDDAFLRRLRFVVDFPLPGERERLRIWKSAIPPGVATEAIDFPFLASRFPLAGGHIRSIVFNACLQSARPGGERALTMEAIVAAVKREHDKLDRRLSFEKYGPYAEFVKNLQ